VEKGESTRFLLLWPASSTRLRADFVLLSLVGRRDRWERRLSATLVV